jgi:hypothetical protein
MQRWLHPICLINDQKPITPLPPPIAPTHRPPFCIVNVPAILLLLFCLPTMGQSTTDPQRKWLISWNPLGLVEPSMAFRIGIGYHPKANLEVWSETSLLHNILYPSGTSTAGIRQILQVKRFINKDQSLFVAAEIRYIYFTDHSSDNFRNTSLPDTPLLLANTSRHHIFGIFRQSLGFPSISRVHYV